MKNRSNSWATQVTEQVTQHLTRGNSRGKPEEKAYLVEVKICFGRIAFDRDTTRRICSNGCKSELVV
jgi:hypothetical protein